MLLLLNAGCLPAGVTRLVKKSSSGMRVFYCANVPDKPERSRLDMSQLQILAAFFRQHADARLDTLDNLTWLPCVH